MTNIREVSRLAGVSTATVSRTLKNPDIVSVKTRKVVLEAVEKAGYRPNLLARNFSTGKSHAIVVLVPNVANPFFSRVIRGIEQTAQELGYSVLLGDTQGKLEREQEYARLGLTNQADGLIQLYSRYPFAKADRSLSKSVPMVNACERIDGAYDIPIIELDNRGAAQAMTQHLVDLGHTRISVVTGPSDSPIVSDRLRGYKDVLKKEGIKFDRSLVANGDFSMSSGVDATLKLVDSAVLPTAIFCFNDEMAIGAIHCLRQRGLRVPEDISVTGFDNIEVGSFVSPALTTIDQPAGELGRQSMVALYKLMMGESLESNQIKLPYDLIIRDSSQAPK